MNVLIATPTYDYSVQASFYASVVKMVRAFARHRPEVSFEVAVASGSLVDKARNAFATRVLTDSSLSHLLFIDADMGFEPSLIAKMLAFDQPIVGCVAPRKFYNLEAAFRWPDPETALVATQPYVLEESLISIEVQEGSKPRYRVSNGFVRVHALGTGIMLIKREALERMRSHFPDLWVDNPSPEYDQFASCRSGVFQCFASVRGESGIYMSEDISFSHRWTAQMGCELWACITEPITHIGREVYRGTYIDKLRLVQSNRTGAVAY